MSDTLDKYFEKYFKKLASESFDPSSFGFDSIIFSYNMHRDETLAASVGEFLNTWVNDPRVYFKRQNGYSKGRNEKENGKKYKIAVNELLKFHRKVSKTKKNPLIIDLHDDCGDNDVGIISISFSDKLFRGLAGYLLRKKLAMPMDMSKEPDLLDKRLPQFYLAVEIHSGDAIGPKHEALVKKYYGLTDRLLKEILVFIPG